MKKKILALLILSALLLPSCADGEGSKESQGFESKEAVREETLDSEEASASITEEITEEASSADLSVDLSVENEISEPVEENSSKLEETSEESFSVIEESREVSSENSTEESSMEEPSSVPDSDYEIMDTPVIPVPDTLTSAKEDAFFNDSVFVGNSIMLGYEKFAKSQRAGDVSDFLGNAKFFTAGSWGVYHNNRTPASASDAANPSYQGTKYSVEDAVGVMGVKTVYLNLMGLNDLALYGDSKNCSRKCADDVIKLIEKIKSTYPDVEVVILSATYLTASRNNYPSLNNKNLSLMNNYLLDYCNENGLDFVDIASQLTEKGCLADKYASDGYCHLWTAGFKVWTAILRDYAVRKTNGTYSNPEKMPILGINK